jgi:Ribonuclease G/E
MIIFVVVNTLFSNENKSAIERAIIFLHTENLGDYIVIDFLRAINAESQQLSVARQRPINDNEAVFSVRSVPFLCGPPRQ